MPVCERITQRSSTRSGSCPDRHLARRAVRERPVRPVGIIEGKGTSELDGVHVEAVKDVVIYDSKLLLNVLYADSAWAQGRGSP